MRALLFHSSVPCTFWPNALSTSTYLVNIRPCRACQNTPPHTLLFGSPPQYDHLRTFGCLCYPNTTSTAPHKLAPRSIACVFLGYPAHSKDYRCYDPVSQRVLTSRHVYFDENIFPFRQVTPSSAQHRPVALAAIPDIVPLIVSAPVQH